MAQIKINKAVALYALAKFALASAHKLAEATNGEPLTIAHGRDPSDVEKFIAYAMEKGEISNLPKMMGEYLTNEETHAFEDRENASAKKRAEKKAALEALDAVNWDAL